MIARPSGFSFDEEIDRREAPALKVHPAVVGSDGEDLFAASVADMDFGAPDCVLEALQERLEHGVFGYEAVPDALLPAIAEWQQRRHGWTVEEAHILRVPNILNALAIAASLFTDEGDGVVLQPPVFYDFFDILEKNRRDIICNPLVLENGRYTVDFDDLERKTSDPQVKMIFLCNPHNPVGRVWTSDELRTFGEICERHGVLVVSDEMHGDLVFEGHGFAPFASLGPSYAANCITFLSPAKTFNIAACCSGFAIIADVGRRRAFQAENSRLTVNKNNAFASVAMVAAYTKGEPWLGAVLDYVQGNLDLARDRLANIPGVELIEPEGTHQLWLDFRQLGLAPDDLMSFLRNEAGWVASRGDRYGRNGAGFVRLSIACPRAKLNRALERLAGAAGLI